jgi:endoglucanase
MSRNLNALVVVLGILVADGAEANDRAASLPPSGLDWITRSASFTEAANSTRTTEIALAERSASKVTVQSPFSRVWATAADTLGARASNVLRESGVPRVLLARGGASPIDRRSAPLGTTPRNEVEGTGLVLPQWSASANLDGATPATTPAAIPLLTAADFGRKGLRGFNLDLTKLSEPDFAALAASGASIVRLMIPLDRCDGCTSYRMRFGMDYIDRVVLMGQKYRFWVVITLYPFPPDVRAEYWLDPNLSDSIRRIWKELAARYRDSTVVGGYDLLNEPNPPESSYNEKVRLWSTLALTLAQDIRAIDPSHVVIVALPAVYWMSAKLMRPLPISNVVYTFHMYDPYEVTHQGLMKFPVGQKYPEGRFNKEWLMKHLLQPVIEFQKRSGQPVFVGEFSCIRWAPDDSVDRYIDDMVTIFESQGWSWTYHSFRGYHGWNAEIEPSPREELAEKARRGDAAKSTRTMDFLRGQFSLNRRP